MVTEEEQSDMELASEMIPVPQVPAQEEIHHEERINQQVEAAPPTKKSRTRKKTLHAAIRKQMEFYFSDANLARDRFLGNLVKEDPNVDLEVFLKFNKIRALTEDRDRIAKALKDSTILEVSEDGTKVRRVTPQGVKENSDECTVYVQRLPRDADHEMLSSIFSQYGPVAYISIPKYRQSQNIKGFCFVEFDKPENAEKCLKAFREKGYELPSETSPNHVLSITTYEKETTEENNTGENKSEKGKGDEKSEEGKKSKKRQATDSLNLSSDEKQSRLKKAKEISVEIASDEKCPKVEIEDGAEEKSQPEEVQAEGSKRSKKKRKLAEDVDQTTEVESAKEPKMKSEGSDAEEGTEVEHSKKSKKKRKIEAEESEDATPAKVVVLDGKSDESSSEKKDEQSEVAKGKKKKNRHENYRTSEKADATELGLQVMAKKDWKKLRNKYLDLQRSKMHQLKQHLVKPRRNQWNNPEKVKIEKEENEEGKQEAKQDGSGSISDLKFTAGLIVKIDLDQPCVDVQTFKKEFRSNNSVKYVDVSEGAMTAFVRFDSVDAAKELASKSVPERKTSVIADEEEKWYWEKMQTDRVEKLSKKVQKNQRGRNKLLKKAEKELGKHIKFDEV